MSIFIPEWVFAALIVYVGMGVLMWPVLMVRATKALSHNKGWTLKTTIFGRRFNLFRFVIGHLATVLLWPFAMREI